MYKYYKILELPYDAPLPEIKQAYRDLVRVWHPDKFARDERLQKRANEKLTELNEAYRVLRSFTPETSLSTGPNAEPIDWTHHARTDPPPTPASELDPIHKKSRSHWHWWYGVVGIPLIGLMVIMGLHLRSKPEEYASDPLPPPEIQIPAQYAAFPNYADSERTFETTDSLALSTESSISSSPH